MAGLSVGVPAILTHTFSVGVFLELLQQSLQWEWTQLLHTDQCRVLVGCCCLPLFQQGIVMLPRAQHHLLDTARIKEEKVWCIGNVGTVSEVPSTDMVSSRLIPIPIQRFKSFFPILIEKILNVASVPLCWDWSITQHWSERCSWCQFSQTGNSTLRKEQTLFSPFHGNCEKEFELLNVSSLLTENLSRVLGPTTMRGLRKLRIICLLSRWKYWAGVVGLTTAMFTLSPSTPSSLLSHIWATKEDESVIIYTSGNL